MDRLTERMAESVRQRHADAAQRSAAEAARLAEAVVRGLEQGRPESVAYEARALVTVAGELYAKLTAASAAAEVIETVQAGDEAPVGVPEKGNGNG